MQQQRHVAPGPHKPHAGWPAWGSILLVLISLALGACGSGGNAGNSGGSGAPGGAHIKNIQLGTGEIGQSSGCTVTNQTTTFTTLDHVFLAFTITAPDDKAEVEYAFHRSDDQIMGGDTVHLLAGANNKCVLLNVGTSTTLPAGQYQFELDYNHASEYTGMFTVTGS